MAMRVPSYERREVAQAARPVGVSAPQSGIGQVAGGLADVGQMFDQWQADVDEGDAKAADTAFSKDVQAALYDPSTGYLNARGGDAMSRLKAAQEGLQKSLDQRLAGLNPAAKEIVQRSMDARLQGAMLDATQHAGKERLTYLDNQTDARIQSAADDAALNPALIGRSMRIVNGEIASRAERYGWSPERRAQESERLQSEVYRLTATGILQNDPVAAAEFVAANAGRFSAVDLVNIRNSIVGPLSDAAGRDAVANVTAGGDALDAVVDGIIRAESGGNANAKNPNSSATGAGQFIDSTWLNMIKRHRPDLAAGSTDEKILSMRADAALSRDMTKKYAAENAAGLIDAGHEATPGNIYLAHFLGPAGARSVLSADDGASAASALPAGVIKANGFLSGMSISDLKAWAARKAGGGVALSPAVAAAVNSLPANLAAQVRESAGNGVAQWRTQQATQAKAQQAAVVDDFKLRIATADPTVTQQEIINRPDIDAGEKATLITSLQSKQKDTIQLQSDVAAFSAGSLIVNPYDGKDTSRVDALWREQTKAIPDGGSASALASNIVEQTGVVPIAVMGALRTALGGTDRGQIMDALTLATTLHDADPQAIARRDGGAQVADKVELFRHLTQRVGIPADAAAKRIADMNDPEKVRDRKNLLSAEPSKKWIKDNATPDAIKSAFNGWFSSSPEVGENPAQAASMAAEYRDMLEESLLEAGGNTQDAKTLADAKLKRRYGLSEYNLSQKKAVVRLPPEVTYPAGIDGTHGYVGQQALQALKEEGIDASRVFFQSDTLTESDVAAGRPPRYAVFYVDGDGLTQQFQHPFSAVPPSSADVQAERKAKALKAQEVALRARQFAGDDFEIGPGMSVIFDGSE